MKLNKIEAPQVRDYVRRLDDELVQIKPDSNKAIELDWPTTRAFVTYGRRMGWKVVRRKIKGSENFHVWRLK